MAALKGGSVWDTPRIYKHHEQQNVCYTRPKHREGRRLKAVKVYTINLESRFLLVQGVPAVGVTAELVQLFAIYGVIEEYRILDEYPAEQFTEVYLFKFQKLTSARAAKRRTDDKSFYGGLLHVCYAPEYENVEDTRRKLQDRRRYINRTSQKSVKEQQEREEPTSPADLPHPSSSACEDNRYPNRNQVETPESSNYLGFPLLPLPPWVEAPQQALSFKSHSLQKSAPTEDKMGSLHRFIPSFPELCKQTSDRPDLAPSGNNARDLVKKNKDLPTTVPRFIPRTTHLEKRKRKMDPDSTDLLGLADRTAPMFGPKLPEQPRVDMEDGSLNTTANLIRQTMTKVASVSTDHKSSTTAKQRRRI